MSDLERCDICQGKKKIMGIGGMEKKCKYCDGVGWIEKEIKPVKENKKTKR